MDVSQCLDVSEWLKVFSPVRFDLGLPGVVTAFILSEVEDQSLNRSYRTLPTWIDSLATL